MSARDAIFERFSCRDFTAESLREEEIQAIIAAAQAGPTARNLQQLRFTWVSEQDLLNEISDLSFELLGEETRQRWAERGAQNLFYAAPHVLFISSLPTPYAAMDAGIATQSACIMATELGLGSCIIAMSRAAFQREAAENFCERLGFAPDEDYQVSIAFGRIASRKDPHTTSPEHVRYL